MGHQPSELEHPSAYLQQMKVLYTILHINSGHFQPEKRAYHFISPKFFTVYVTQVFHSYDCEGKGLIIYRKYMRFADEALLCKLQEMQIEFVDESYIVIHMNFDKTQVLVNEKNRCKIKIMLRSNPYNIM
ncbi:UNVERIFIED_CONTAM: hypothetical protein RMT77_019728 [Armadillidium vulgare]